MSIEALIPLSLLVAVAAGFYAGRSRAYGSVDGAVWKLHSLPGYYGWFVAVWTGLPALLLLLFFGAFGDMAVNRMAEDQLRRDAAELTARVETAIAADTEYQALLAAADQQRVRIADLDDSIKTLRDARGEARDPEQLEHLRDERGEAANTLRATQSAAEERREVTADATVSEDLLTASSLTARAGYSLYRGGENARNLFIGDARRIAAGDLASRDTAELRTTGELISELDRTVRNIVSIGAVLLAIAGFLVARAQITPTFRARNNVERLIAAVLLLSSVIAILTTVGIVASLLFESLRFFSEVSIWEFLFGLQWSPQTAIRADQVGQSGAFGAVPLFAGTAMITLIAMIVAVPIGLFAAIYLSEYATPRFRQTVKPILEILAGIPTVVYGFFALLTVGPAIRGLFSFIGFEDVVTQSALSAGLVMGVMIIPFISSLADDVINAVPQSLRDGAFAMGATRSETIRQVVLPAALPGIVGAVLLAVSRAIGETMIVVMAAGQGANLTANPLESVTTITVQIVMLLTGDQEFDSAKTLSAFALGLVLFVLTLIMNMIALRVVQKYREKYD